MLYEKTTQIRLITVTTTFRFISSERGLLLAYLYVQHQHADSTFRNQRKEVHLHGICHLLFLNFLFLKSYFLKKKKKKRLRVAGVSQGRLVIVDNALITIHQHATERDFPGLAMPFV